MLQEYQFCGDGSIAFDDEKSVKELVHAAFEEFDYEEPAGMELVTVFQSHHSKSNTGWFTTDVSKSCAEEIENKDELNFAYHLPGVFYYAEGGWGHHMTELGNHPTIPNPVTLSLEFADFENTVVICGSYRFQDIVTYLKRTEYVPENCSRLVIHPIGLTEKPYALSLSDKLMTLPLTEFKKKLEEKAKSFFKNPKGIYNLKLEIC